MAELRKSYSNYILRRKRQLTSKGSLYERDWMTVSELGGFAPGTTPVYASGNFKMTVRDERSGRKKYSFSNWLLNDEGEDRWTLSSIKDEEIKASNKLIHPNYSSILDFAYYGSCVELIRGTVNDLTIKYPGELYIYKEDDLGYSVDYFDETDFVYVTNLVENPFGIDIWTEYINPEQTVNPNRYMCISWSKYEVFDSETGSHEPLTGWNPGYINKNTCPVNGEVMFSGVTISTDSIEIGFKGIYVDGRTFIVCTTPGVANGKHIRLKEKYIDEAFDGFDDFESTLLNRDSIPMYKAKLYTPKETENGVVTYEKAYIWPTTTGEWNLDLESDAYESYLEGLLYLANYYDECRTDNIWRSYTHETIKNFDWTTPKDTYVPEMDGHIIDVERIPAILRVCGRQFDDIKRYLENIKYTSNVSYDSKNNMPDEALGRFLEMNGWEVKNVAPINDNDYVHDELYPGKHARFTPENVNNEFLKRMILNSRNILSKKGTRSGIEAMYSMFGIFDMRYGETIEYCGTTYPIGFEMDEFTVKAAEYIGGWIDLSGTTHNEEVEMIHDVNNKKNTTLDTSKQDNISEYHGLMAEEKFMIDGIRYLVPWYDIDYEYDGYQYYQMFGGWGKRGRKNVLLPDLAPNISEIESDDVFKIYDETVKNIKVVEDIYTLNMTPIGYLKEGDVYYVLNTQGLPDCEEEEYSNYVFFASSDFASTGFTGNTVEYNNEYVWCIVNKSEFEVPSSAATWYTKEIIYLESIHDLSIGNNPHNGNQKYDDGREFFEYYKLLFKGAFDRDMFSDYRNFVLDENSRRNYERRFNTQVLPPIDDETTAVTYAGFELLGIDDESGFTITDNSKIWYFLSDDNGIYSDAIPEDYSGSTLLSRLFTKDSSEEFTTITEEDFPLAYERKAGEQNFYWNAPIRDRESTIDFSGETMTIPSGVTSIHPYGPDETWSYSVINTKNIRITYHLPWEMEDYVTDVVEFYVKQLIPSTAIVEFVWDYTGEVGRPASTVPYSRLSLSPAYQSIRSYETTANIGIDSINVENIGISEESTI